MATATKIKPTAFVRDTAAEGGGGGSSPQWAGGWRWRDEIVPDPDSGMIEHADLQRLVSHVMAVPSGRAPIAGANVSVVDYGGEQVGFIDTQVTLKVNGALVPTELLVDFGGSGYMVALADVRVLRSGRVILRQRGV